MPSILCRCGEALRYGEIPNPIEWLAISDTQYGGRSGNVDAEQLYRSMRNLLKCPACGRLWIYWNGFASPPAVYLPE
jgi:hypothetical protein